MEQLKNAVHNIDCFELMAQIPDESIDLVVTDPPYNLSYPGRVRDKFETMANDTLSPEEHTEWFDGVLQELHRVLKQNTSIYIFIDFRNYARLHSIVATYFTIKSCIVWDKIHFGMGQDYRFQHEFIIYATKGKDRIRVEKKNVSDVWQVKRVCTRKYKHPTQKPVEIMSLPVQHGSDTGALVLDPFAGVGTLAVACAQTGREFICAEIDENYCKIADERLSNLDKE